MELTNTALQTVDAGSVVVYDAVAVRPSCCMAYREGSGQITLKGQNNGRRRYLVSFEANVGLLATGDTPAANTDFDSASLAIAIDGEPVESARMIVTPAALGTLNNVSCSCYVDTPCGCCVTISVENTTGEPIEVQNASLLATRTA